MTKGTEDVIAERNRQIASEGWSDQHDDKHTDGDLANAGACYAQPALRSIGYWPWDETWWKPKTRRHDLVRAAALIIAEIDRIDRHEACA